MVPPPAPTLLQVAAVRPAAANRYISRRYRRAQACREARWKSGGLSGRSYVRSYAVRVRVRSCSWCDANTGDTHLYNY